MRDGMNALNVIDGVKKKLAEIKPSLPAGVEVVAGYDRSGLIQDIHRDAAARPAGRGHHRQPGDHRLSLPFPLGADSDSDPAHRRGRLLHSDVLPGRQFQHHVARRIGAGDWRTGGRGDRHGRKRLSASFRAASMLPRHRWPSPTGHGEAELVATLPELDAHCERKDVGSCSTRPSKLVRLFSFRCVIIVVSFLPVFLLEAQEGRMFRPLAWTKTLAVGFSSVLAITLVPVLMVLFIRGRADAGIGEPDFPNHAGIYLPVLRLCLRFRKTTLLLNLVFLGGHAAPGVSHRQPVHAAAVRGFLALHAHRPAGNLHHSGVAVAPGTRQDHPLVSRG